MEWGEAVALLDAAAEILGAELSVADRFQWRAGATVHFSKIVIIVEPFNGIQVKRFQGVGGLAGCCW